MFQNLIILPC